jgi:hypothetical protein
MDKKQYKMGQLDVRLHPSSGQAVVLAGPYAFYFTEVIKHV